MNVHEYTAPNELTDTSEMYPSIFLAGTIDNGDSYNWQSEFIEKLKNTNSYIYTDYTVFNPRRENWDKTATYQDQVNQIEWEHRYLDLSDVIIMNILPNSKSPISLMEIGLYAQSDKLMVFCTPEFYRYANVETVCKKYNIPLYNTNKVDDIIYMMKMYTM